MARAKHTVRADARRRYRATTHATDLEGAETDASEAALPANRRPGPPVGASPVRPGIRAAFRASYHRANVREDLAALPGLLRSRGFLAGVAMVALGVISVAVAPRSAASSAIFNFAVADIRGFPALTAMLVVGFFAPRASYLLGLIIGVLIAIGYGWFVLAVLPQLVSEPLGAGVQSSLVLSVALLAPALGLLVAAIAAWYRRFLAMSSRARAQARPAQSRSRTSSRPRR